MQRLARLSTSTPRDLASWSASVVRPHKNESLATVGTSLLVFQACAVPAFVHVGPKLLAVAERVPGLRQAAHWVVKKSFFAHFCGGEDINEVHATMMRYRERGIGVILNYAVEAEVSANIPSIEHIVAEAKRVSLGMIESADIASEHPGNFIAAKLTPFVPPTVLLHWTTSLRKLKAAFDASATNGRVPHQTLASAHDFAIMDAVLPHMEFLVAHAQRKNVKVIVDAEWTYVQPAIDDLALHLSKKFNGRRGEVEEGINGGRPVIFNTYQMYLKDALGRVKWELERAERGGYNVGIKIVRGAYIVSETERALKKGYDNPICHSLAATHASFNSAIDLCIETIARHTPKPTPASPLPVQFFSASHNFESVFHAYSRLQEMGIDPQSDCVGFGQLMGMQDGTTYGIAAHGLRGYKCVPYGPVDVTIPYLIRRAQENSAVLGGVKVDKENLWQEIRSRFGL
ncbi:FAD-linked oxidoreductase-like protein [Chytriomyces sp. MP71]|nr:FAD-linked oxidoreductase-like protein [Chytriomyces sp. MP71]